MSTLRKYEEQVIEQLLSKTLSTPTIRKIIGDGIEESYESTDNGYFISIKHKENSDKKNCV